jgi:lysophospholipase L1-like esterase
MKIKLLSIFLALLLFLASCTNAKTAESIPCNESQSALLGRTEDLGEEYLDSFIFFGESTTYHLKCRGVLRDGVNTKQVWAPSMGTVNLDFTTKDIRIVYPETGELLSVADAAARSRPQYLVMTFGLNGAVQKVKKGEGFFKASYKLLIDSVRNASPDTRIILQSAFPVASNMDMKSYTVSASTLNKYIDTINRWTLELASDEGLRYLDTSEILKDDNGFLLPEYQCGDGHHLTTEAYKQILAYIRTHGYK